MRSERRLAWSGDHFFVLFAYNDYPGAVCALLILAGAFFGSRCLAARRIVQWIGDHTPCHRSHHRLAPRARHPGSSTTIIRSPWTSTRRTSRAALFAAGQLHGRFPVASRWIGSSRADSRTTSERVSDHRQCGRDLLAGVLAAAHTLHVGGRSVAVQSRHIRADASGHSSACARAVRRSRSGRFCPAADDRVARHLRQRHLPLLHAGPPAGQLRVRPAAGPSDSAPRRRGRCRGFTRARTA